jgi:hypothetical protein
MTPKKSNVLLNSASFKGESISEQIYMGCDERNGHGDRQKAPLQLSRVPRSFSENRILAGTVVAPFGRLLSQTIAQSNEYTGTAHDPQFDKT